MAMRMAQALAGLGLVPGDRLAVQVEKSPAALALYLGALAAGVVFLPLNTAYTADELGYFLADSGAALLVGDPARAAELQGLARAHGAGFHTLDGAGAGSLAELAAAAGPARGAVERGPGDLAAIR
jgi:malonyl-CoA/methylmalonyl-CoA synthetase